MKAYYRGEFQKGRFNGYGQFVKFRAFADTYRMVDDHGAIVDTAFTDDLVKEGFWTDNAYEGADEVVALFDDAILDIYAQCIGISDYPNDSLVLEERKIWAMRDFLDPGSFGRRIDALFRMHPVHAPKRSIDFVCYRRTWMDSPEIGVYGIGTQVTQADQFRSGKDIWRVGTVPETPKEADLASESDRPDLKGSWIPISEYAGINVGNWSSTGDLCDASGSSTEHVFYRWYTIHTRERIDAPWTLAYSRLGFRDDCRNEYLMYEDRRSDERCMKQGLLGTVPSLDRWLGTRAFYFSISGRALDDAIVQEAKNSPEVSALMHSSKEVKTCEQLKEEHLARIMRHSARKGARRYERSVLLSPDRGTILVLQDRNAYALDLDCAYLRSGFPAYYGIRRTPINELNLKTYGLDGFTINGVQWKALEADYLPVTR